MIKMLWFWSLVKCEFWTPTLVSGYFTGNESIVGDGGQTGYLFGGLQSGFCSNKYRLGHSIFNNRIFGSKLQPLLQLI
jgi:hypothetical protein